MRFLILPFILSLVAFVALAKANARSNASPNAPMALIYNGPGTCKGCPETIADRFEQLGYRVQYVGAKIQGRKSFITQDKLSAAKIYVQPGGSDILSETLSAMTPQEKENIRAYVHGGGTYIGVCAGGYIAGTFALDEIKHTKNHIERGPVKGLGLIPCYVVDEDLKDVKARAEPVRWIHHGDASKKSDERQIYFQDGPRFCDKNIPDQRIYGIYKKTGHVAAMTASFGQGRVGVIGPHPEADAEWFADDHLTAPKRLSTDLFDEMVLDLNPQLSRAAPSTQGRSKSSAD